MYGGRQFASCDQGWVGWFCKKATEVQNGTSREPFTISGTGKQVRDVLHAEDMKRLYAAAVKNIDLAKGQAFNIGGGISNSLSLLELFALLEDLAEVKLNYCKLPARESDQRVFVSDISKAIRLLGWEPEVSSSEGVRRMFEWVGQSQ
jgi:CDP-paratose 2-epimerase